MGIKFIIIMISDIIISLQVNVKGLVKLDWEGNMHIEHVITLHKSMNINTVLKHVTTLYLKNIYLWLNTKKNIWMDSFDIC